MIIIGCDHGGYELKEEIVKYLKEKAIPYQDMGCYSKDSVNYPEIAKEVATEVQKQEGKGIIICRSGIGMSMVANKFKGIRCALCDTEEKAKFSRMHNDSNMIALGADYITVNMAICIVRMWIATEFEGGRHQTRVDMISQIEKENMK